MREAQGKKEWKEMGVFEEKGVLAVDDGEDVCWEGVAMSVALSVTRASLGPSLDLDWAWTHLAALGSVCVFPRRSYCQY